MTLPLESLPSRQFLAFVTAAATELTRTGLINDLVTYLAGEEDQTDNLPPCVRHTDPHAQSTLRALTVRHHTSSGVRRSLPWDWAQVGHDTVANLTKDTLGQTLTRSIEISAKPMLTRYVKCHHTPRGHP